MKIDAKVALALRTRKKYVTENTLEAYRLLTRSEADLPLAVDIYKVAPFGRVNELAELRLGLGDNAVIHVFDDVPNAQLKELENTITVQLAIRNFFYKNRAKNKLNLPPAAKNHQEIIIQETHHKFLINLSDYLDCGLFLDHRETRQWIGAQSRKKTVLNMFAYSGSFSVYAGAGGAAKTYSVDLSAPYCEWTKKNLALNHLPPEKNWVYKMDAFEFLKYGKRKNLRFDIIILDPPTFSRNKGKKFSVQKDHPRLIQESRALLNPNGFILFSNNFEEFRLDRAAIAPAKITEKTNTAPLDFQNSFTHWCWLIS